MPRQSKRLLELAADNVSPDKMSNNSDKELNPTVKDDNNMMLLLQQQTASIAALTKQMDGLMKVVEEEKASATKEREERIALDRRLRDLQYPPSTVHTRVPQHRGQRISVNQQQVLHHHRYQQLCQPLCHPRHPLSQLRYTLLRPMHPLRPLRNILHRTRSHPSARMLRHHIC